MISMPSESWLNILYKHKRGGPRYPDIDFVQLTLFPCNTRSEVTRTCFIGHGVINRYIPEIHLAIILFSMQ